jgi:hypothetical protein
VSPGDIARGAHPVKYYAHFRLRVSQSHGTLLGEIAIAQQK